MSKYSCIIILYKPSDNTIKKWHKEIQNSNEGGQFIIVDNTPKDYRIPEKDIKWANTIYIALNENLGIAEAQNIGILKAIELKTNYLFFFDQDSIIPPLYFKNMIIAYDKIKNKIKSSLILGPKHVSINQDLDYKVKHSKNIDDYYIVDSVLSSGSLMNIDVINRVGLMSSNLFIDQVDHEYCYRASANHIPTIIYKNVILSHQIGNNVVKILGSNFIISAPFRYYYQFRNAFFLLKLDYVSKRIKRKIFIRKCVEFIIQPLVNYPRSFSVIRYILKGIRDGIKYKM